MCLTSPQCHVHPPCWDGLWKDKNCVYCPMSLYCRSWSDKICLIVQYNVEGGQSYILSSRLCQLKACESILSASEASVACIWRVKFRHVTYTCWPLFRLQRNGLVIVWIGGDGLSYGHAPISIRSVLEKWKPLFNRLQTLHCHAIIGMTIWDCVYMCIRK